MLRLSELPWIDYGEHDPEPKEISFLRQHFAKPLEYVYSDMGMGFDEQVYEFVDQAFEGEHGRFYGFLHYHGDWVPNKVAEEIVIIKHDGQKIAVAMDTDNRMAAIIRERS